MPHLISRLTALFHKKQPHNKTDPEINPEVSVHSVVLTPQEPSPVQTRQAYLNGLIASCRPVSIPHLRFTRDGPASSILLLDRLYIPPDAIAPTATGTDLETDPSQTVSIIAAIASNANQKVAVTGSPGSGKSTLLSYLALQHACALTSAEMDFNELLPDWSSAPLLPVLVPLPHLAAYLRSNHLPTEDIIEHFLRFDEYSQPYSTYLFEEVDRIGGLFLFDGLDEVSDSTLASYIREAIESFVLRHNQNPATRFIISCRTLSYQEEIWQLNDWTAYQLASLNEAKIRQFVEAWYEEIIRLDQPRRVYHEIKRAKLLSFFRAGDPNRLLAFAANPLILTTLLAAHASQDGLPENRVQIYQACFDQLLIRWGDEERREYARSQPELLGTFLQMQPKILESALQEIAYQVHADPLETSVLSGTSTSTMVSEQNIQPILLTYLGSNKKVEAVLQYFRQVNGVLSVHKVSRQTTDSENRTRTPLQYHYAFLHPIFQEYLAALYLSHKSDPGFEARQHLSRGKPWREVLLLLAEIICLQESNPQRIDSILDALAPAPLPQEGLSAENWHAIWLAGEMLPTYRRAYPDREQEHRHIPRGLVNLLQARGSSLPADERAAAGDTLDLIGDPRFRSDTWYLPDEALLGFRLIPQGSFYMGSKIGQDPATKEIEQPQHILSLPDYFIARYLVTVAQFKAFVDATGYQPANPVSLHGRLSHPVAYVSWHDALHYCQWLTDQLKIIATRRMDQLTMNETEHAFWEGLVKDTLIATIPSEVEWEKAARGPIASPDEEHPNSLAYNIYPWGDEFDPNKANTAETGLGSTSPVGCFPMGASPYGILDMVGNVWEWTRTIWGDNFAQSDFTYPYMPSVERENLQAPDNMLRVIRGGSFFYHNWHTRTSARGRSTPPEWDWDIGFRVAILSVKTHNLRV